MGKNIEKGHGFRIAKLAAEDRSALAKIRCFPDLKMAEEDGMILLKNLPMGNAFELIFRPLPIFGVCDVDQNNLLFPKNGVTPIGKLPELDWKPLQEALPFELPTSAIGSELIEKIVLSLRRAHEEKKNKACLMDLLSFKKLIENSSQTRLGRWKVAPMENVGAMITGDPLPTKQLTFYWQDGQFWIPAGFEISQSLLKNYANNLLKDRGETMICFENLMWSILPEDAFQPVLRAQINAMESL